MTERERQTGTVSNREGAERQSGRDESATRRDKVSGGEGWKAERQEQVKGETQE